MNLFLIALLVFFIRLIDICVELFVLTFACLNTSPSILHNYLQSRSVNLILSRSPRCGAEGKQRPTGKFFSGRQLLPRALTHQQINQHGDLKSQY